MLAELESPDALSPLRLSDLRRYGARAARLSASICAMSVAPSRLARAAWAVPRPKELSPKLPPLRSPGAPDPAEPADLCRDGGAPLSGLPNASGIDMSIGWSDISRRGVGSSVGWLHVQMPGSLCSAPASSTICPAARSFEFFRLPGDEGLGVPAAEKLLPKQFDTSTARPADRSAFLREPGGLVGLGGPPEARWLPVLRSGRGASSGLGAARIAANLARRRNR